MHNHGCYSMKLQCSPPFLVTYSRRRRHSLIQLSMKRCDKFFPFSDNYLLQFFYSLEFSSVINSLLKGTPDSVIDGIKTRAVWGPYVRLDEIDLLFLQLLHYVTSRVRRRAIMLKCPFVTAAFCFNIRQQALS